MKIVFYAEQYKAGGADTVLANIFNHWPQPDAEIIYLTNQDNNGLLLIENIVRKSKIKVKTFKIKFVAKTIRFTPFRKINKIIDIFCTGIVFFTRIISLYFILGRIKPDALVANNGGYPAACSCQSAIIAGRLLGLKKIYLIVHHAASLPRFLLVESLLDFLVKHSVTSFITPSEASKDKLSKHRNFTKEKIKVIYNGIDSYLPEPKINLREKFKISQQVKIIGCLANLLPHKGHKVLIKAFYQSKAKDKSILLIIGNRYEPVYSQCQMLVNSLGLADKVIFCGFLQDHPSALIKQLDLLVLSTLDFEAFGMVLGEAIFAGVPFVATRVGGIAEILEHRKHGFLVEPNDKKAFASAIDEVFDGKMVTETMKIAAKEHFQSYFSAAVMAKRYKEFICG